MITLRCGSAELSDEIFVAEFESCRFPNNQFRHGDHIRLAWIYIRLCGYDLAEGRMRTSIQRFAYNLGAAHKYHETITVLWMRLVNLANYLSGMKETFDAFAAGHDWLFNKDTVFEFYSRERLMSDAARKVWVEPDLKPIPILQNAAHIKGAKVGERRRVPECSPRIEHHCGKNVLQPKADKSNDQ